MKKILILLLAAAAIYPYANEYYKNNFAGGSQTVPQDINEFAKNLNEKLPRNQGYLIFDSVVVSTGSIIFLMKDTLSSTVEITKQESRMRIETWRPFLIDYTCRDPVLSKALKNGVTNNVYYQFKIKDASVDYGKVIVTRESC